MDNIEFFNRSAAAIFKALYEKFPQSIVRFDTETIRSSAELPHLNGTSDSSDIGATVEWLAAEGFIRYTDSAGFGRMFAKVTLTAKGLEALNRVPDALTPKKTYGEHLKEIGKAAAKETYAAVIAGIVQASVTQVMGPGAGGSS